MKINGWTRIFVTGFVFIISLFITNNIQAACTYTPTSPVGPDVNPPSEQCHNVGSGSAGIAVYACSTNYKGFGGQNACYWHAFSCDSSCGGPGVPGGGGGTQYPTCAAGKALAAYSPMGSIVSGAGAGGYQCGYIDKCREYFPTDFVQNGCGGIETKGRCNVSYLCCNPGDTVSCTGTAITRQSHGCLAGEVKLSAWETVVIEAGERFVTPYVSCKRGCSCVTPCTPSSPSISALRTPADGMTTANTTPYLMWNTSTQTWGAGCPNSSPYAVFNPEGMTWIVRL